MEIIIHTTTKKIDKDYKNAIDEYIKRTLPFSRVTVKTHKKINDVSPKKGSYVFGLCHGKDTLSSPDLANTIQALNLNGYSCIEFILQNTNDDNVSVILNNTLNISSFNMSENLTIVVLMEQIYRAYTILNNITYHK